jgi:hypothetical protein
MMPLAIERPSPVPRCEVSACQYGSKIFFICSGAMPLPGVAHRHEHAADADELLAEVGVSVGHA